MKVLAILAFVAFATAYVISVPHSRMSEPAVNHKIIEIINSNPNSTWRAGVNPMFKRTTLAYAKSLCGAKKGGPELPPKTYRATDIPDTFDSRTQWGSICPSTGEVRDQANCGSCWAFGAVEAMTDRTCIDSKGSNKPHLSAEDMNSCCNFCGMGCNGGYPSSAWNYWVNEGLVSGGNFGQGLCYPYSLKPCDHHINGTYGPCPPVGPTPPCTSKCQNGADWQSDKHFGQSAYSLQSVTDIQTDIMTYGPVEAAFDVYEDFLHYRSGVYSHQSGGFLGGHAIKVLGWGLWTDGTPYWTIANSWNEGWGNKGYFLMKRGTDECGIEDGMVAGLPK